MFTRVICYDQLTLIVLRKNRRPHSGKIFPTSLLFKIFKIDKCKKFHCWRSICTALVIRKPMKQLILASTHPYNLKFWLKSEVLKWNIMALIRRGNHFLALQHLFDFALDDNPAPCYLNSIKVFLLLSNQYCNPKRGFKPGT